MNLTLPRGALTDRVDILRRPQAVSEGQVQPIDEGVVEFDVPCKIVTVSALRAATLLGVVGQSAMEAYFGDDVSIEENDVLRVCGIGTRYVVKLVRKYPSPHDPQMQVAELTQDLTIRPERR